MRIISTLSIPESECRHQGRSKVVLGFSKGDNKINVINFILNVCAKLILYLSKLNFIIKVGFNGGQVQQVLYHLMYFNKQQATSAGLSTMPLAPPGYKSRLQSQILSGFPD